MTWFWIITAVMSYSFLGGWTDGKIGHTLYADRAFDILFWPVVLPAAAGFWLAKYEPPPPPRLEDKSVDELAAEIEALGNPPPKGVASRRRVSYP